jgi:tetratricopeptide (TPR) repeat protein
MKCLGRQTQAIMALNSLLDASPTDPEAWAELADLYISQGLYQQAIFALEEVLLITPNAWNVSRHDSTTYFLQVFMLTTCGADPCKTRGSTIWSGGCRWRRNQL